MALLRVVTLDRISNLIFFDTTVVPLRWKDDHLALLDQRRLPAEEVYLRCTTVEDVAEAIRTLAVRGAPLIGTAAAYGMVIGARSVSDRLALDEVRTYLASTRPTAVNLFWALDRCWRVVEGLPADRPMGVIAETLLAEARAIEDEDAAACLALSQVGAAVVPEGARILTHCNAGALATSGVGTALGVIRAAHAMGRVAKVWVDETRPLLQGARLTAWELQHDGIPYQVICDNMAASLMASGQVDMIVVGADRITRNGDVANKIGTYGLAVLAHAHDVPFYVVAPWATIDLSLAEGSQIPIEFRRDEEVCAVLGTPVTPAGATAWNPAFDVTPSRLVRGIFTERGLFTGPLK